MEQSVYRMFVSKVDEYLDSLELPYDEENIEYANSMKEWVEDNADSLDSESVGEIFDEYLDMLQYRNGGYKDDMCPDGDEDGEDPEAWLLGNDEDGEISCIKDIRDFAGE